MRRICILFVATLLCLSSAQAQFGKIVNRVKRATETYTPWSPAQEDAIGEAAAAKMFHALGPYDNPPMTKYVNLVGNTVAQSGARTDIQYHFAILNSEIVNAFAMPGGYVFITRGALANMQSEAELAGVLAHEVAHVDSRHLEKEIRAKKTTSWAVEEGTAKVPGGSELNALTNDLITKAFTSHYSQDKESEADRKGVEFAARAGYDPAGLVTFLQRLQGASAAPSNQRALGLLNGKTHPPLDQRLASLQPVVAAQKQGGQSLADRYAKNVDFSKPVSASGAVTASGGSGQCTLTLAKDKIVAERAALASTAASSAPDSSSNPCSLDEAKAKIVEARQVLQELDRSTGGAPAPQAKAAAPKSSTAAKKLR
jgi:predicted Zn-dependent protease